MADTSESFEAQFEKRHTIIFEGGEVVYIDIHPEVQRINTPLLISSGWAETPAVLKETMRAFAEKGYQVIALDYTRLNLDDVDTERTVGHKKGRAILAVLDALGIRKVNVLGHSEGAINSVLAARRKPHRFCHMVLIAPAGFSAQDSFPRLTFRFIAEIVSSAQTYDNLKSGLKSIWQIIRYVITNPVQAFKEAFGTSQARISCAVKALLKDGVSVSIICSENDNVFPVKKIRRMIKKRDLDLKLHLLEGGHNAIHLQPEEYATRIAKELHATSTP